MKIPLKYNIRSLLVRWVGTLMTAVGIALAVAVVVVMMAMVQGLDLTFTETGDNQNLVVLREGSVNEVNSYFTRDVFEQVRFLPGVLRTEEEPLAVGELVVVINHMRKDGEDSNVMVRGVSPQSFVLRPGVEIVEGRMLRDGLREVIVSESLSRRFEDMSLGDELPINNVDWKVVGIFQAGRGSSAHGSEIWAGYQDVSQVWQRPIYSSILLRAESEAAAEALMERISEDQRIQLNAVGQRDYYSGQTVSSVGLKALTMLITVLLGVGACFAIMNMMYGTVMSRQQEIATMRALGFRRRSILASFLMESAFLGLVGGLLGCLIGSLFHGYSAGTSNFTSFSEVLFNFRVTEGVILMALLFSTLVGVVGGFLPARRAATVRLMDVMRR